MSDGVFRFDMYTFEEQDVRMIEMTATDLRKDLFRVIDRMLETGESLRIRRRGKIVNFEARVVTDTAMEARIAKFDAAMALGVRDDAADFDPGDITDGAHLEWTPEDSPR